LLFIVSKLIEGGNGRKAKRGKGKKIKKLDTNK
jgi:hypothetical protein